MTSQGTVADMVTGVNVISGAVTLFICPACGQFRVAVVCTTGSSGVSTAQTKPIRPAIIATHRVTLTSPVMTRLMARLPLARASLRSSLALVSRRFMAVP
jgi:predicted RNA-binding Zn-ribbon protein involved in translation (DUF1610 family)